MSVSIDRLQLHIYFPVGHTSEVLRCCMQYLLQYLLAHNICFLTPLYKTKHYYFPVFSSPTECGSIYLLGKTKSVHQYGCWPRDIRTGGTQRAESRAEVINKQKAKRNDCSSVLVYNNRLPSYIFVQSSRSVCSWFSIVSRAFPYISPHSPWGSK